MIPDHFLKENRGRVEFGKRESGGRRSRGKGNCGWDVAYERRINK